MGASARPPCVALSADQVCCLGPQHFHNNHSEENAPSAAALSPWLGLVWAGGGGEEAGRGGHASPAPPAAARPFVLQPRRERPGVGGANQPYRGAGVRPFCNLWTTINALAPAGLVRFTFLCSTQHLGFQSLMPFTKWL